MAGLISTVIAFLLTDHRQIVVPVCFDVKPSNPQHQAEYDCPGCRHEGACRVFP